MYSKISRRIVYYFHSNTGNTKKKLWKCMCVSGFPRRPKNGHPNVIKDCFLHSPSSVLLYHQRIWMKNILPSCLTGKTVVRRLKYVPSFFLINHLVRLKDFFTVQCFPHLCVYTRWSFSTFQYARILPSNLAQSISKLLLPSMVYILDFYLTICNQNRLRWTIC